MAELNLSALAETPWLALQGSALLLLLRLPADPRLALRQAPTVALALLGAGALGAGLQAAGLGLAPARFLLLPLFLGAGVLGLMFWHRRSAAAPPMAGQDPLFTLLLLSPALLSHSLNAAGGTLPLATALLLPLALGLGLPLFAALFARLENTAAAAPGRGLPIFGQRLWALGLIALGLGNTYGGA